MQVHRLTGCSRYQQHYCIKFCNYNKTSGTCTLITTLKMNCRFTLAYVRPHQETLIKLNILVDFGILNFDIADLTCSEIEI